MCIRDSNLASSFNKDKEYDLIGLIVSENTRGTGIVIEKVNPESEAYKNNLRKKDIITEIGKTNSKTVVSEVESVLVNIIKDTPVRGYEIFAQDVTLTKNGYYRAWIGLRLPLGEYNKMFNYTIEQATDAYNLKYHANKSFEKLMKKEEVSDGQVSN